MCSWRRYSYWWRFSLRSILFFTLLAGVFFSEFSVCRRRYAQEVTVANLVADLGGNVYWEQCDDSWSYPIGIRCGLKEMYRRISQVRLAGCEVTNADVAAISELRRPFSIVLDDTEIGDDSLQHLGRLESLAILSLSGTRITDAGLSHLQELPQLEQLNVERTPVTNSRLQDLAARLPRLDQEDVVYWRCLREVVGLEDIPSSMSQLQRSDSIRLGPNCTAGAYLSELSALESLRLDRVKQLSPFLMRAHRLSELTELDITPRSDDVLPHSSLVVLGRLPKLQRLRISGLENIGIETLQAWAGNPNLRALRLPDTNLETPHVDLLLAVPNLQQLEAMCPTKRGWTRYWMKGRVTMEGADGAKYESRPMEKPTGSEWYRLDVPTDLRWRSIGYPEWFWSNF